MSAAETARNEALAVRGVATRFQPGQKGGPGRPPLAIRLPTPQELASPHAKAAIATLRDRMDNSEDEKVRVQCARYLAELAKPDDDEKLLRMLEDRLRDIRMQAEEYRKAMEAVKGLPPATETP